VRDGKTSFVLARGIGQAFVATEVEPDQVRALLDRAAAA
jgi:3-dehydroquinate synthase